ncbi:conserved hypothetical protein [Methylobacterium nodulans ORS 2060]|uniref:Uncharacterized protein n=2 Tax=Methylobacterium nodulans TaxID=114616 RepID=B8ICG0_METNO|nr:conserved hypothetical protein [Methylobacterium nodulans ORS 2060]
MLAWRNQAKRGALSSFASSLCQIKQRNNPVGTIRHSVSAVLISALAACGYVPVTSMLKLSAIDFRVTDPRALRAAVELPKAMLPRRVVLRFIGRINNGPDQTEEFDLEEINDPTVADVGSVKADRRISAYRLTSADANRLTAFRSSLFRQKAEQGGRGEVNLEVRTEGCRAGPFASGPVLATTYIKTSETGTYVPLMRNFDLRTIDPKRDLVETAPQCQ